MHGQPNAKKKEYVYWYSGPVLVFGKLTSNKWQGMTTAPSMAKAKSNLAYQYRKELGQGNMVKVEFPGKIYRKD